MKSFCIFLFLAASVFLPAREVYADTVVDITATRCDSCFPSNVPVNLQAQLTVEAVTGTFFNSGGAFLFTGSVFEVIGITGTLDGNPISPFPAPAGDGSWLNMNLSLGTVYFSAGGSECWIQNDNLFNLIEILDANGDGFGTNTAINYSATAGTPEPPSFLLLAAGLSVLAFFKPIRNVANIAVSAIR